MFWTPPSNNQINSNTNPYRCLTTAQLRQNTQRVLQEATDSEIRQKIKDQYTWDAEKGKYVRVDGKKTAFDDLVDQYTWDAKKGKYVRLDGEEGVVTEGAVKNALSDYLYSIPKEAIEELRPVMKIKNLTKRFSMITKVLKKHGFNDKFMGSFPSNVVNDYYDKFFGESAELGESHLGPEYNYLGKDKKFGREFYEKDGQLFVTKGTGKFVQNLGSVEIKSNQKMMKGLVKEKVDIDEVSPPGWEGTVKAMKKHKEIDNPWALAWWMKGKGYKSHKESFEMSVELDEVAVGSQLKNILTSTKPSEYTFSAPAADGSGTFAVIPVKNPSGQAGVMMATFDTKGSTIKLVDYHGTHRTTDSAKQFAKKEGLIESVEMKEEKFTSAQLDKLKQEYGKIKTVDPSSPTYDKLTKFLDGLSTEQLQQMVDAKIPFLRGLALNRINRRKGM